MFVGAIGSGVSVSQMPSISKAKDSACKIFGIIEEESQIDSRITKGNKRITTGSIEFKEVNFRYPSRRKKITATKQHPALSRSLFMLFMQQARSTLKDP